MRTSRTCPKCGSREIAVLFAQGSHYVSGEDIRDTHLCADCGYAETYFRTPRAIIGRLEGEPDAMAWLNPRQSSGPFR